MAELDKVPLPPDPNTRRSKLAVPPGSWDTHFHIFGPPHLIPYSPTRAYSPPAAPIEHYFGMASILGLDRGVMVQPAVHGFDNFQIIHSLKKAEGRLRGIVRNNPEISIPELEDLHATGVRGVRFSFAEAVHGRFDRDNVLQLVERVEPFRWLLDFHTDPKDLIEQAEFLRGLPLPVIIDHFGMIIGRAGINPVAFKVLLDLLSESHIWVKLATADRMLARGARYEDIVSVASALVERAPNRIIWGTDWPHPYVYEHGKVPNDGDLLNMLLDFVPDENIRRKVLVDNADRLFGFD